MNVSAMIGAFAQAAVVPGDAVSRGSYEIGMRKSVHSFSAVDQVYSVSVNEVTGQGLLDLCLGELTLFSGGSIVGGDGKDADGQDVALSKVHAIHWRNKGEKPVGMALIGSNGTGPAPFSSVVSIPVGGEILFAAATPYDYDSLVVQIEDADPPVVGGPDPISFDLTVFGAL